MNSLFLKIILTKMNVLDQITKSLKRVEIKYESADQNNTWKLIKNDCVKKNLDSLPLNTPLNPDKVTF